MRQPSRSSAQLLLTVLNQTAQQIISTAVTNCSEEAEAQLPPLRHIRRGLRRVKKDAGNPIPVPQNLQTMEIPEEYTVTHRDEPFLLYDSGIDSPVRILVFSTETNLRALTTTGHWFADGTFKTAPELFYQIYTIHTLVGNNILLMALRSTLFHRRSHELVVPGLLLFKCNMNWHNNGKTIIFEPLFGEAWIKDMKLS